MADGLLAVLPHVGTMYQPMDIKNRTFRNLVPVKVKVNLKSMVVPGDLSSLQYCVAALMSNSNGLAHPNGTGPKNMLRMQYSA